MPERKARREAQSVGSQPNLPTVNLQHLDCQGSCIVLHDVTLPRPCFIKGATAEPSHDKNEMHQGESSSASISSLSDTDEHATCKTQHTRSCTDQHVTRAAKKRRGDTVEVKLHSAASTKYKVEQKSQAGGSQGYKANQIVSPLNDDTDQDGTLVPTSGLPRVKSTKVRKVT